ncbi:unnamed protein product, partial [Phaeothamnion confervicola]
MLRRLHDAWRAAAGDRKMPAERDLPPASLPWATEFLTIQDVRADGDFHFRVDAPHTANIFGSDMTGRLVSDYPEPRVRDLIRRTLVRVVETAAPVLEMRNITISHWRWEYEIFLVPLSDDGVRVDTVYS